MEDRWETAEELIASYQKLRAFSRELAAPLSVEDMMVQTMPDVSPTKWHLGHTTWFFETFVLLPFYKEYSEFHPQYSYLFNSYYVGVGERHRRDRRGLLSRPSSQEVFRYREVVDTAVCEFLAGIESIFGKEDSRTKQVFERIVLGIHHEQQHQELLLMDIKHVLFQNPLAPAYLPITPPHGTDGLSQREGDSRGLNKTEPLRFVGRDGGLHTIGYKGDGFSYDNEGPVHQYYAQPFALANRCINNEEYSEFIADGGYRRPELWLSDGFAHAEKEAWSHPLYWQRDGEQWLEYKLRGGLAPLQKEAPVCHLSYFEADAYARWAGARLAREEEWEIVAEEEAIEGNFVEGGRFHPIASLGTEHGNEQLYGNLWEITQSPYSAYPGYRPAEGAIGEYNGKFMSGQMVMRGGSCFSSQSHLRPSYRNFFYPHQRWNCQGLRLAKDG